MEENNLYPNKRYAKSSLEELESATHNLSKGQLQKVFEAQKRGQKFEQIPANRNNDHLINEHEKFVYHVRVTIPQFDPNTGKDNSESRIDKFNPAMFEQMKKSGVFDGKNIDVLHDPTREQMKGEGGKFINKPVAKII